MHIFEQLYVHLVPRCPVKLVLPLSSILLLEYSIDYRISTRVRILRYSSYGVSEGNRSSLLLPNWLSVVTVKPTCWLAAGSGFKAAAACKSATCQAKTTTKSSISYFTKNENDRRR